jgi:O-glycosyl hydrolase
MKPFLFFLSFFLISAGIFSQQKPVTITIDVREKAQLIENIGASGAWFTENIGRYWPPEKKERLAELLFSKTFDKNGNPKGIGLSAWRFNIGGGSAEQGQSSGISNPEKRVECFLSPDGRYNWNKQEGYIWFVKKAAAYGVKDLVAFSNTAPVQFTKNGLAFKTQKDYSSNLSADKYAAYAEFLATVLKHFDQRGLHFKYISPVNEPQWDWSGNIGQASQEGSPWSNPEIYKIALHLDTALRAQRLTAKILLTEAGDLRELYAGKVHASRQVQLFYDPASPLYLGGLKTLHPVIAGHSYFTDQGDTAIIRVREQLRDTVRKYNTRFWQSEYSMLGTGYKEGKRGRTSAMDCALFLAKIIHYDLTVGNASAWHFWNSWEPGRADADTRYYLIALKPGADSSTGDFSTTKNLWALGHFSRFIRPGMHRILVKESGKQRDDLLSARDLMLSAYSDGKKLVIVAVNYAGLQRGITLELPGSHILISATQFVTTEGIQNNMTPVPLKNVKEIIFLPRSITTIIIDTRSKMAGAKMSVIKK